MLDFFKKLFISNTVRDTSERKHTEEELRQSEERFRLMVEGVQDYAIFMLDPSGRIITWNIGAQRIKGYTAKEIIGSHFSKFYPEEDIRAGKPAKELQVASQTGRYEEEGWRIRKDGSRFWANVVIAALRDAQGHLMGFSKVTRDMTDRKRAELELKNVYAEIERSNQELEQFAYVASHDLQEPLRMIASYCQLLEKRYKDKLDEDGKEFIAFAVDGAKRMQGLIADLLAYSRVGTKGKEPVPVDCEKILERVLLHLKPAIEGSGAVISHTALPVLMADETQLGQLFQNLIGNAIKFCKSGSPQVQVEARKNGEQWMFSIRDNGIGIDPEFYSRIFVMFQRLNTREEYPGTGIGLAICKKIVERHGGRIWVESKSGHGTTFFFTIPNKGGSA